MNVVELEDINLVRAGKTILNNVTWRIGRGEHAALLGANGSGKTTLLKVLTGYEWPTSGRVRVLGREYGECDLRALRREIGWVSSAMEHRIPVEDDGESVAASGFDASFGLYRALLPIEREKARSVLDELGMGRLKAQAFGLMSQGEQKRVLIARALVHDPSLLVLDEPCAGLDPAARALFLDDVGRLAAQANGPTIVLVTHHIDEIRPWIRRALALRLGHRVAEGPVTEVLTGERLSSVFERKCRVIREKGEYRLELNEREVD